ncbi:hypothetical protein NPIL_469301 [Nephila pilipes]|uniref:RED-like N-terminal domain-containing protein n=1 Tax=Nephila pilipes TaxID=299642 RepID=A0A8X6MN29_NEPPI|nr:hypothetical protein NPIL_469301 [Nephila pilipes]
MRDIEIASAFGEKEVAPLRILEISIDRRRTWSRITLGRISPQHQRRGNGRSICPSVSTESLVELLSTESDTKSGLDTVERRRQMFHESKFLSGGIEHTHLVKYLHNVLLQKKRSENNYKEKEKEELESTFKT